MKLTTTLLAAMLMSASAYAQTWIIPTSKKTLIYKATADWCGPCGGFGWTQTLDLINTEPNAITVAYHSQSTTTTSLNVSSSAAAAMEGNLDLAITGIPSFVVGRKNMEQASTSQCRAEVASATSGTAVANTGFLVTWKGDSLIVNTRTKFFSAATGDYYVAVYAYENDVVAYQNGQPANPSHHHIFRMPTGATNWGTKLNGTSFTVTSQQDITFKYTVPTTWNKNKMTVFAVIWKKNGTKYDVVNVNSQKSFATSIANTSNEISELIIYPNPASGYFSINTTEKFAQGSVTLTDVTGKVIKSETVHSQGQHVSLNGVAPGVYIVTVQLDEKRNTQRIVVQ
ncbi:MAG: T9SS type A sorting domain-containing protein [Flavipsychrobacter sp.]|nr:T9SS type A sorting domain-containing protein [Flavipsychrobacter sp.]